MKIPRRSLASAFQGAAIASAVITMVLIAGCDASNPQPTSVATPTAIAATPTAPATDTPAEATPTATPQSLDFSQPQADQLSLAGAVAVSLPMPANASPGSLVVRLDGEPVTDQLQTSGDEVSGTLDGVAAGQHTLTAEVSAGDTPLDAQVSFETVALQDPEECEILNDAECMLPYPSSRFLTAADTPTGWRLDFPQSGMPAQQSGPLLASSYSELDGFSPTVQILMHFPGGVDPALSNASRLLPETRTYGLRSLDADSPTVLIDADSGEHIIHFIEPDAHATTSARQVIFLRPGISLTPGHHYIVAARHLVHADGSPVEPEPVFAALRDGRPSDIAALESRRAHFEDLFASLDAAGVPRSDLILAFDFVVQSDQGLTGQMLSMRDQAFAWFDQQQEQTFHVDRVSENDCSQPGLWRRVDGTYEVPLFLTSDPVTDPVTPGVLNVDENGTPVQNGFTNAPFTISIPCTALDNGGQPRPFLYVGHGLFQSGSEIMSLLLAAPQSAQLDYVGGATDWRGLSAPDINGFATSFVVSQITFQLKNIAALADRLRQGQLNALLLAHMMHSGAFNTAPQFQTPTGTGVFIGPQQPGYYYGISLGGIMGLMFSALSPDVQRVNIDVGSINFSLLLQRATPFIDFENVLELTGLDDPMKQALALGITHELWARGESAGYATHITKNPLPGTNAKNVLMTVAFLDQQVSNQGSEITARTLGLPNLVGSRLANLPLIPDEPGPLPSALEIYDTGSFDLNNPAHQPFIPPLANEQATPSGCDPHPIRLTIPASIDQVTTFLQPGGMIENFCHGICDAAEPYEIPFGDAQPCNPVAP